MTIEVRVEHRVDWTQYIMKIPLLKVENLTKVYSAGQTVWKGIQFKLDRGEFLYILGGSGAGKSSLLRTIASFEQPTEGTVTVLGTSLQQATASEMQRLRRRVAYIPQNLGLVFDLTVRDHIELTRFSLKSNELVEYAQIKHFLKVMSLESYWDKKVGALSGGERQRVALLRALCKKTDLIIADEPTGSQDFEMTWKIMDLLVRVQLSGTAILFATHDLEMVRRLRKRVGILKEGALKVEESRGGAAG